MVENGLVTFDDFPLTAVIHTNEISNPATIMLKSNTNVFDRVFWVVGYWLFFIGVSVFSHIVVYFENFLFTAKDTKID